MYEGFSQIFSEPHKCKNVIRKDNDFVTSFFMKLDEILASNELIRIANVELSALTCSSLVVIVQILFVELRSHFALHLYALNIG